MLNIGMSPVVLATFSVLVIVGSAAAQRTVPVDISVGPGIGKSLETDCPSYSEGGTRITLSNCSAAGWGLSGGFAVHVTDHLALTGSLDWSAASLDTNAEVDDIVLGRFTLPIEMKSTGVTGGGGVRFYFQPLTTRVRGFAGLGVGYKTANVKVSALGITESDSAGGVGVAPAVGVEAGITPSLLVRISAGTAFAFTDDGPATALSVDAALAFRVGEP